MQTRMERPKKFGDVLRRGLGPMRGEVPTPIAGGPHGDRGLSSLDSAIELGMEEWGVTVLEAVEEADAGDIWETRKFRIRPVGKSSIYRHEVRRAAVEMRCSRSTTSRAGTSSRRRSTTTTRT